MYQVVALRVCMTDAGTAAVVVVAAVTFVAGFVVVVAVDAVFFSAAAAATNSDPTTWREITSGKALGQRCGSLPIAGQLFHP